MIIIIVIKGYQLDFQKDAVWIILGSSMTIWGAEFPDMDQMFRSVFKHRDWYTHSAIFPAILSFLVISTSDPSVEGNFNTGLLPVVAMINIGVASHLIADYFPTWKPVSKNGQLEVADMKYALGWAFEGLTGDELVQKLVGTYLIHIPWLQFFTKDGRVTMNKMWTRVYLIANAIVLIILSYYMINQFAKL